MLRQAHVEAVVPVSDIDAAVEFYEGKLGLPLAERVEEIPGMPEAWFYLGDAAFALYESAGAGQSRHTLAGFVVDDVEAVVEGLRRKGVVFEEYDSPNFKTVNGIAQTSATTAAFLKDPDGNILVIRSPRPRSPVGASPVHHEGTA